uniref:IQ domain-containing protein K-like isoform X2 n=1 Tax=Ciona intestinalis TaxID=7719 RepID=UPI000EF46850|nr:IQ domain-containing protein K-like isoform X2 [Ciona intestinalis]|eukprot:XP_026696233.1 IQ domain-containing protein K-like isoform X2 [Ciona intestinalis]
MFRQLNSPKVFGDKKVKSLWEQICDEYAAKKADYDDNDIDDTSSIATDVTQYSASRHTPIVYGKMVHKPQIGTPQEYLESHIFPTLVPAMTAMLNQAKVEKCFERKRTRFNACDFLTEYLYQKNPNKADRSETLWEIPFVEKWNNAHPREPLPLSLQWTEEEAAIKIQSFFRGYLVRIDPEVSELRAWQRSWKDENRGIRHKVEQFWETQETGGERSGSQGSKRAKSR